MGFLCGFFVVVVVVFLVVVGTGVVVGFLLITNSANKLHTCCALMGEHTTYTVIQHIKLQKGCRKVDNIKIL